MRKYLTPLVVVPSRIELESRASETLILSVVLQDLVTFPPHLHLLQQYPKVAAEYPDGNGLQNYAKKFTYSNHSRQSCIFFQSTRSGSAGVLVPRIKAPGFVLLFFGGRLVG